jgi:hypothetical protein
MMMKSLQIKFWEKERCRIVAEEAVAFTSFCTPEAFSAVTLVSAAFVSALVGGGVCVSAIWS